MIDPTRSPTTRPGKISFNQMDMEITIRKGKSETHECATANLLYFAKITS
jgi:hypothetical protein